MRLRWRSGSGWRGCAGSAPGASYESEELVESKARRGEVSDRRRCRSAAGGADAASAGAGAACGVSGGGREPADKMDAALLRAEIERLYVTWGVKAVEGLTVDGVAARAGAAGRGPGGGVPGGAGSGPARDRADRRRKKKLVVAFHFQFANQAGWECDECRKTGLEKRRRCGWLGFPRMPICRRFGHVRARFSGTCPKSYITAESEALIEDFFVRKRLGGSNVDALSARQVEAFVILEQALAQEKDNGHHDTRRAL